MSKDRYGTKYDRLYVAIVTPFKENHRVDEAALRKFLQYYMQPAFVNSGGGIIINPEAGEIFYLSRKEKRRNVEIALEECGGKVPVFAGVLDNRTEDSVKVAIDAKAAGVDGVFLMPPIGIMDITICWDAEKYPESLLDFAKASADAVDLPAIVHPIGPRIATYGTGIPVGTAIAICKAIPNIIGWKMIGSFEGLAIVAQGLRSLERHVGIFCAGARTFHESLAAGSFDGTASGGWNYAMEPMLEHINAWRRKDIDEATKIWNSGLPDLHRYVAGDNASRLHIRYKIATWLRGLIPLPVMRPPMPKPRKEEILTLRSLIAKLNLSLISEKEMNAVIAKLDR